MPRFLALVRVPIASLQILLYSYEFWAWLKRVEAKTTPQINSLERFLQIKYGDPGIRIIDIDTEEEMMYPTASNPDPDLILPSAGIILYPTATINANAFVVDIPAGFPEAYLLSVRSTVQKFKLPSIRFAININ
ncbi:MAG: hypothetical protein PHU33_16450 [Bacteroidales bacterium]|nr:hypothetical protein [Bacteroidales bacterium]